VVELEKVRDTFKAVLALWTTACYLSGRTPPFSHRALQLERGRLYFGSSSLWARLLAAPTIAAWKKRAGLDEEMGQVAAAVNRTYSVARTDMSVSGC
jgi:hypothetical protein